LYHNPWFPSSPIQVHTITQLAFIAGFSLAVGLFCGIYPAQRAAKLNPSDALWHE
jgi:putative ABC transport system permease protein